MESEQSVNGIACPYCQRGAKLVLGSVVYPHRKDLQGKRFWACMPCDAYVGCHEGSTTPFGRLANAELRRAKQAAHTAFDALWKGGRFSRREAYRWLSGMLGIAPEECHIGKFDLDQCKRVVAVCPLVEPQTAPVRAKAFNSFY